jgi:hypothetical protein
MNYIASGCSTDASPVSVRVIPMDEELMIARSVARLLSLGTLNPEQPEHENKIIIGDHTDKEGL